ncbi:hypothetical protein [Acuticoccus sediminis]|uniref:hypothetical protein n=1 Tax=Acuticoccus sediminis TaxID=2184697 RepID=UPI001390E63E|nr:hypothetical protein [Acuticoccus sediminis]
MDARDDAAADHHRALLRGAFALLDDARRAGVVHPALQRRDLPTVPAAARVAKPRIDPGARLMASEAARQIASVGFVLRLKARHVATSALSGGQLLAKGVAGLCRRFTDEKYCNYGRYQ